MSKNREEFLKISSLSQFFPPKNKTFPGCGNEIFAFLVYFPYSCNIPNLVKIGQAVLREDDRRQHMADTNLLQ